jgi:hypothetical protein
MQGLLELKKRSKAAFSFLGKNMPEKHRAFYKDFRCSAVFIQKFATFTPFIYQNTIHNVPYYDH